MNKLSSTTSEQLAALVKRLEKNRKYMAWILASYQRQEKISENKLLEKLQISHDVLLRLAMCISPNSESAEFHAQVAQVASYCNIDNSLLTNIIRQVESLDALSSQPTVNDGFIVGSPGVFAAARDNEKIRNSISPSDNLHEDDDNATEQ
jgi:hypothetical protein